MSEILNRKDMTITQKVLILDKKYDRAVKDNQRLAKLLEYYKISECRQSDMEILKRQENADRGLYPKKQHTGYWLSRCDYRSVNRSMSNSNNFLDEISHVWEVVFNTPFPLTTPVDEVLIGFKTGFLPILENLEGVVMYYDDVIPFMPESESEWFKGYFLPSADIREGYWRVQFEMIQLPKNGWPDTFLKDFKHKYR